MRETGAEGEGVCVTLGPLTDNRQSSLCHMFFHFSCEVMNTVVRQAFVWDEPHWQGIRLLLLSFIREH